MKQKLQYIFLPTFLIAVTGCGDDKKGFPVPRSDAKAETFVVVTRTIEIGSEQYKADFGTITVPENRSKLQTRLISIPFLRIHARASTPDEPIFGLAGGPGSTNLKWDWGKAGLFLPGRDFVLVGYRGVDGSTVLDCPEVTAAFKAVGDPLREESMRAIGRAWTASAERLIAEGVDLDGYTMLGCIEDIEAVCGALGYRRINLLSESYGTRVAYLYGLKHPERIFRSAMIAVNPPGRFIWEPQMVDEQLKQYAALWSMDSVLSHETPDLYAAMRKVLNTMPRSWLFFSIDPGKIKVATFALLFHRNTAAMVFDAFTAAARGDASGLAVMSLAYDYVIPTMGTWGDLASKAVSADFGSSWDYSSDMDPPGLPLGSPLSKMSWGPLMYAKWPMDLLPEAFRKPQKSDVETLFLSGSIDFSTPARYAADDLLPCLKHGKPVVLSECGHVNDVWYANAPSTRLILTSFYNTGVPDVSLNSYMPMKFDVQWGFPRIAKLVLAAIVLIVCLLAAVIFWFVRKLARRRAVATI